MSFALVLGGFTMIVACVVVAVQRTFSRSTLSLPGPRALPILGNVLDFDRSRPYITFTEWKEQFGDVFGVKAVGNSILVLNSLKSINELLDKRGSNYSHRPVFTVVGELMGLDKSMPLMPYGPQWRHSRKLAHKALSPSAVVKYHALQEDIATMLAREILDKPDMFFDYVRMSAARIVIVITYGISVKTADSEFISQADATMKIISESTIPGAYLCDLLPSMKYLPSWLPFQKRAAYGKNMILKLVTMPFERVKSDMIRNEARPSLTEQLLSDYAEGSDDDGLTAEQYEEQVKWTTGSMYGAGGETTYTTVLNFIAAMALHPNIQKRAHAELLSVVGPDTLPTIAHRPALPYLAAVIKETMRWSPALPLSIARRSDKTDSYQGFHIPEGTIVMPNVWSIAFLPDEKYDPSCFIPERFLDAESTALDPALWAFGFGRRICPGKNLGENSVFILIATLLAAFEASEDPNERLVPSYENNLIRYPKPFKCCLEPRSDGVSMAIRRRAAQSEA